MAITFGVSGNTVEINARYEFNVELKFSYFLNFAQTSSNTYTNYDPGSPYDKRYSNIEFIMNQSNANILLGILKNYGRGDQLDLTPNTGFFPFGPDKGDGGGASAFKCRLISWNDNGWLISPYRYHSITMRLLMESAPAYVLPSQIGDGPLTIGSIISLEAPQNLYKPLSNLEVVALIAENNTVTEIDHGSDADSFTTNFQLDLNHTKAAALINYIVATGRGTNSINFIPGDNAYPFGADLGNGPFNVQIFSCGPISQETPYQWIIPLTLHYVSG